MTGMPKCREPSAITHMQFFQLYSDPSVSARFTDEKHTLIWQATILVGLRHVKFLLSRFSKAVIIQTQEMVVEDRGSTVV